MSCENNTYTMDGLCYTSDGTDYTQLVKQELQIVIQMYGFVDTRHIMQVQHGMDLMQEKLNYIKFGQLEVYGLI